jgi:hypothetical protein
VQGLRARWPARPRAPRCGPRRARCVRVRRVRVLREPRVLRGLVWPRRLAALGLAARGPGQPPATRRPERPAGERHQRVRARPGSRAAPRLIPAGPATALAVRGLGPRPARPPRRPARPRRRPARPRGRLARTARKSAGCFDWGGRNRHRSPRMTCPPLRWCGSNRCGRRKASGRASGDGHAVRVIQKAARQHGPVGLGERSLEISGGNRRGNLHNPNSERHGAQWEVRS